ncbi:MAG TPA: M28 family peptidase [Gemmatimonadaceae bacterium]
MKRLAIIAAISLAACSTHSSVARLSPSTQPDSLAIRRDIEYLASNALAGRLTGTPGNDSAAAFIARRYKALELAALAPDYEQHFIARPPAHARPGAALPTQNVAAVLPGRDKSLREEFVIVGAHFDHLGTSTEGALDPDSHGVRLGADDNASGTAAVLELARLFKRNPTRRSLIFVNFSGEEQGVLGSSYFADHLPVPVDSVDAMVNFDMVGRLKNDRLIVYGVLTASEFPALLDSANLIDPLKVNAQGDGFGPSDHASFYAKNIPVLHFFTDLHEDYHKATDTPDKINAAGEARVVAYAERVIREIADRPSRLSFVRAAPEPQMTSTREGTNVYMGSIPDMASGDVPGLRLSGVTAGTPADIAGLKAGDVIVEFDRHSVKDLYEYSDALYSHKPGDEVDVVVLRAGQRLTLHVKLGKRGG